jgi:hypothetical protein
MQQQQQQQQRRAPRSSEDQKRQLVQLVTQHGKDWRRIGPMLGKTARPVSTAMYRSVTMQLEHVPWGRWRSRCVRECSLQEFLASQPDWPAPETETDVEVYCINKRSTCCYNPHCTT